MKKNRNYDQPTPDEKLLYDNDNDWKEITSDEFAQIKKEMKKAVSTKQISLRIPLSDIERCEARAKSQGFKYQSIIKALIHQYATGKLNLTQ